jgi:hypothetical protein
VHVVRPSIVGALFFLVCCVGTSQEISKATSLEIAEEAGSYVLTVPVSRLVMTIPKGGFARIQKPTDGSTSSPRYFFFEDKARHLIVSGWFESDQGFSDIKRFWADETAAQKRQHLPEAQDVSFERLGSWNAVLYDVAVSGAASSHIRAECLQAGTWIDVHLSLTADLSQAERRVKLRDELNAIRVSEKNPSIAGDTDTNLVAAREALTKWAPLMDSGLYEKCWDELAQNSKEKMSRDQWLIYMKGVRKPMGELKARKEFNAEYIKSLKGIPDQDGALIQFESSFSNRGSVVETFGFIHAKDGQWRVGYYLTK